MMRVGIATIVTLLAFGYTFYLYGEQEYSRAHRNVGLALLLTAAFGMFWGGLIVMWAWAL